MASLTSGLHNNLGVRVNVNNWGLRLPPDSKVYGANMGPTWVLSAPDGPYVGPLNLAIRVMFYRCSGNTYCYDWQSIRNMLWWCYHNNWPNSPQFTDCIKDFFLERKYSCNEFSVNESCSLSLTMHNSQCHGTDKALPEPINIASAIWVNASPEWVDDLDTEGPQFFYSMTLYPPVVPMHFPFLSSSKCPVPKLASLTHLGLTLFSGSPPGAIREIEGFATHICVSREMGAVFHDAYMWHQAKMS